MGFFSDIGDAFKRTVANPAKLVADLSTFGGTAILRTLPKAVGGGQAGVFAKGSEVYGGTAIGVVTGFAAGGPAGAVVGGASGFGRGVSGVIHNESGKTIAGGSAKWAAITGSLAGAVKGVALARTGQTATTFSGANASGLVGKGANTVYADLFSKSLTSVAAPATTTATKAGAAFSGLESLGTLAVLKLLQGNSNLPGTSGGSTGVTLNQQGPGTPTSSPAQGPDLYPGVPAGLQTISADAPGGGGVATAVKSTNYLLWVAVAFVTFYFLMKKKHG